MSTTVKCEENSDYENYQCSSQWQGQWQDQGQWQWQGDTHEVPVPGTLALMLPVVIALVLRRKR